MLGYFRFVLAGDQVQVAKPDPEIYLKACAMLRLDPAEVLVLEDSWNGVRSAHSAGAPVILIPDLQKDTGPVEGLYLRKMESLEEVKKWAGRSLTVRLSFCIIRMKIIINFDAGTTGRKRGFYVG